MSSRQLFIMANAASIYGAWAGENDWNPFTFAAHNSKRRDVVNEDDIGFYNYMVG